MKALLEEDNTLELDDFINVRSNPKDKKGFFHFFDRVVTCVSGKKNWTPSVKVTLNISDCNRVTISDKAFAKIVLINYWDRWVNGGNAKFTDCRNGSLEFQGWGSNGHTLYNNIYKRILAQRNDHVSNNETNTRFLQQASKKYKDLLINIRRTNAAANEVVEEACMDDF